MKDIYNGFEIYCTVTGPVQNNVYYVVGSSGKGLIVDPSFDADKIKSMIDNTESTPVAILLTHGHFDHVMSVEELSQNYNIPVIAPVKEKRLLEDPAYNLATKHHLGDLRIYADKFVDDGEVLTDIGVDIKVIATPGHTEGSTCYFIDNGDNGRVLLSGDTLFCGTHGKLSFPTGSMDDMKNSLLEVVFKLPQDTVCYPGHGDKTTINYEIKNNIINYE